MKVVVTGARGLLGWHTSVRMHARNCAARFRGEQEPFDLVALGRGEFNSTDTLRRALDGADAVLHFAGVNRAPEDEVEAANPAIAELLVAGCKAAEVVPKIVYANSTHAKSDTPYGRSKRRAGEILAAFAPSYTDLVLPHIFGECAQPYYNNVTATLIDQVINGHAPTVNPEGQVQLLHAGIAAEAAIAAIIGGTVGVVEPSPSPMSVPELLAQIESFHAAYHSEVFPSLNNPIDLALFNSYRTALYPEGFPRSLKVNRDARGMLFEAVKGGGGGQTFLSWTEPGVTRGDHFHLQKVERFLVLEGEATIRIRRVLQDDIWEYRVSGEVPTAVDMPVMHTHSIENTGDKPLLTLFWAHEIFDPEAPDTYADPVLRR